MCGLTDDGEAFRCEERGCRLSEVGVVVDDEHRRAHALIVANAAARRIVASPSRCRRDLRTGTERRMWPASFRPRTCAPSLGLVRSATTKGGMMKRGLLLIAAIAGPIACGLAVLVAPSQATF